MSARPSLVWFCLDLRLHDNPALAAAVERGSPIVPVFIWAPEEEEPWPPGEASRWWLHQSLRSLQRDLASRGSRLTMRGGPSLTALERLLTETGADAIFWNRRYEPALTARDAAVESSLRQKGIRFWTFNAGALFEPGTILSKGADRPFQVFSPFWKACLAKPEPASPLKSPQRLSQPSAWPESASLADFRLQPRVNWAAGFRPLWSPGESGAVAQLETFLRRGLAAYAPDRDRPDLPGTSRLSPHLHFGEISPRSVWHALAGARTAENAEAVDCYLKELGWREFAYHLLFHFPQTPNQPLHADFTEFPWRADAALLKKWQRGITGYPLVDAGMRELWATGWMHNRVRMVVASFLTKHMRTNWEEGAYWFWDTLVDADLANNTLGWQWSAGCGADAAPYFRIFNPIRQGERFDPDGKYIRQWVPELRRLAPPWIHSPWTAPTSVLDEAGIQIGGNYPRPIVDHQMARREALASFDKMRRLQQH